jgi:hypothetical protein
VFSSLQSETLSVGDGWAETFGLPIRNRKKLEDLPLFGFPQFAFLIGKTKTNPSANPSTSSYIILHHPASSYMEVS